jgi:DNA-binding SARP family transcriptional activator/tetratricopeptide (TPR) repeat protein
MSGDDAGVSVSVRVLGEIAIDVDGKVVALPTSLRAVAMLGWLAIHPGPRPRSEIASSLWPDVPDSSARNSVRSALWSLRQVFGKHADAVLDTSRNRIGLHNVSVDFRHFAELVSADRLDDALALGAGELLAGLDDEWVLMARDAHRDRLIALLAASSNTAAADGDSVLAIARARAAAELNPLSESCARLLMCRYEEVGDRSVALGVYTRIVDRLRRELKIAPSEDTWRLAETIRTRQHDQRRTPVPANAGHAGHRRRRGRLIGRDRELAMLERAWRTAQSGTGGVAIVHGEAGIGKTRLVAELAEIARASGGLTATGTTSSINGAPYWPWAELGGALLRGLGTVPDGQPFASALAPLLPTHIQPGAPGPPDFEQARLTEGLLDLLEFAASQTPLLLVLEDMHACDEPSVTVLARAVRRVHSLPVLLVWTRRHHPVPTMLAEAEHMARHCGALLAQIGLERLADEAISAIAHDVVHLDEAAVGAVVAAADGNALLAVEAARTLARGDVSLPEGLRSTVRAASAHLPAQSAALCATVAVAGRATGIDDVRRRHQQCDDAEFDAAFEGAHDAGLLTFADGMLDFRHALLREAYYADLPQLQRTRLHAAAARDLDQNGEPELAGEAARHLLAAGDHDAAAELLVRAAHHAVSLGALTRAEDLLTEALELTPSDIAITLELAEVAAHRGLAAESQERFERALEDLNEADDPVAVAAAHIRWAEWNLGPLCRPQVAKQSVGAALEALDTAGVFAIRLRLEAQAFMALCEAMAGDPDVCEQLLDTIDAQCCRLPAEPIRDIRRHVARSLAHMRQGRFGDVADSGREAAAIARSIGRLDLMYGSLVNAAAGLAATGSYQPALELLDEIGSMPSVGTLPLATEAEVQMSRAWLMSRLDRHAEAVRVARSAERLAERIGAPELTARVDAESGRVLLHAGFSAGAAALLAKALDVPEAAIGRPMARLELAEALTRLGRLDEAKAEVAATALEPVGRSDWPDVLVARMSSVRALIAAADGDSKAAEHHLQRAAACWRRRIDAADAGERYAAVLADLGRPVIGLISPVDELDTVLANLAQLDTARGDHADLR